MAVRILIADDNPQVLNAISSLIRSEGFEVCGLVGDGEAAVQKAIELKPDLVILDLRMPKRGGLPAGRDIHASLPNTPILLYTNFSSSSVETEAHELGFQAVIEKTNPDALIDAIQNVLRLRRAPETRLI